MPAAIDAAVGGGDERCACVARRLAQQIPSERRPTYKHGAARDARASSVRRPTRGRAKQNAAADGEIVRQSDFFTVGGGRSAVIRSGNTTVGVLFVKTDL